MAGDGEKAGGGDSGDSTRRGDMPLTMRVDPSECYEVLKEFGVTLPQAQVASFLPRRLKNKELAIKISRSPGEVRRRVSALIVKLGPLGAGDRMAIGAFVIGRVHVRRQGHPGRPPPEARKDRKGRPRGPR